MRALIISGRGVQDQELIYPYYRLLEAEYQVTLAAEKPGEFMGIQGVKFNATEHIRSVSPGSFDLLVIPGGVKCMEHLRLNDYAVNLVREFHAGGKVVASICSGAQMLISAGLVKGRVVSCYPAMRIDVENAGGQFHDGPVAYERIVTAPHYKDLGGWMQLVFMAMNDAARPNK